jgi:hypothetical protein
MDETDSVVEFARERDDMARDVSAHHSETFVLHTMAPRRSDSEGQGKIYVKDEMRISFEKM